MWLQQSVPRWPAPPLGVRRQRVLLADDDAELRLLIARMLRIDGYRVIEFSDGPSLLDHLGSSLARDRLEERPDLLVSDIRMPGVTGLDILSSLRASHWRLPVILISAFDDPSTHAQADRLGADALFHKPLDFDDFRTAVFHTTRRG
jgi:CheY-like chemotaxis protein